MTFLFIEVMKMSLVASFIIFIVQICRIAKIALHMLRGMEGEF